MGTVSAVLDRELGDCQKRTAINSFAQQRLETLQFSTNKSIKTNHDLGVNWLDLDPIDHRYLLSCAGDASISIFDTLIPSPTNTTDNNTNINNNKYHQPQLNIHSPLCTITRQTPGSHRFSINCITWYPIDCGLFISGSSDQTVKVWDANTLAEISRFSLDFRIHRVAMSEVSSAHALVAVCGSDNSITTTTNTNSASSSNVNNSTIVYLCDIVAGGFSHTLQGHLSPVMALHWSPVCEWELATTDRGGRVLFWDVRRAGVIACLDQQMTRINSDNNNSYRGSSSSSSMFQLNNDNKTAHDGAINSIVPTPDGLFWLTSGGDDRIRCWNASTHKNMLTHYPHASNPAKKAIQVAISQDGSDTGTGSGGKTKGRSSTFRGKGGGLLFQPTGTHIQVYDVRRGGMVHKLIGHMSGVNCCTWNEVCSELYSGDEDGYICVWDVGGDVEVVGRDGESGGRGGDGGGGRRGGGGGGGGDGDGERGEERNAAIIVDNDNDNGDESDWSD